MTGAADRSYYRILGVSPSASTEEIRREYHRLARVLHPDRYMAGSPAERTLAERRMREVNEAWSVLRDGESRRDYDRRRASSNRPPRSAPQPPPSAPERSEPEDGGFDEGRWDEDLLDEPPLPAWQYHLLRRGPLVAALAFLMFVFLLTAYANTGRYTDAPATTLYQRCGPELGIPC